MQKTWEFGMLHFGQIRILNFGFPWMYVVLETWNAIKTS
jgi:hypothetical protein